MLRKSSGLDWRRVVSISCILGMFFAMGNLLQDCLAEEEEGANLIKNPGFEEGNTHWRGIKHYEPGTHPYEKPKGGGMSETTIDDHVAHSGKHSLKMTGTNNRAVVHIHVYKYYVEAQGYNIAGKYRISGWIKIYNLEGAEARVRVSYWSRKNKEERWKYIGGENIGSIYGTTDWTKVSMIITTPSDPDFGRMEVSLWTTGPNTGIVWFDDISLVKLVEKEENIVLREVEKKPKLIVKKNPNNPGQSIGASRNLLPGDSSFETGRGIIHMSPFYSAEEIEVDSTKGIDGRQSLKLTGGGVTGKPFLVEPGKTYTFSLYACSDKDGVKARFSLNDNYWRPVVRKRITLSKEWKRYFVTIKAKQKEYWPGFGSVPNTICWIDAFQLEEGDKPTPYKTKEPINVGSCIATGNYHHVFLLGEKLPIDIGLYKSWPEYKTKDLILSYQITDFYGKVIEKGEEKAVIDNDNKFKKRFSFPADKSGLFTIRTQVREEGKGIIKKGVTTTFAVVRPPVKIAKGITPFCGITEIWSVFAGRRVPTLKKIGTRWAVFEFHWGNIEQEKGKFKWPKSTPNSLFSVKKQGFRTEAIISVVDNPDWACDKEELEERKKISGRQTSLLPVDMKAWRNFIHQFVTRYKDVVDIYAIGLEVNGSLGTNSYYKTKYPEHIKDGYVMGPVVTRYAEMVKIASEEILKVVPDAMVGAIAPSGGDCKRNFPFSTEVFKEAGKDFNIFPLNSYIQPHRIGPGESEAGYAEKLFEVFENALELVKKYGSNQHIYISEAGWHLDTTCEPDSSYAREYASRLAKMYLISRMTEGYGPFCGWFCAYPCTFGKYSLNLWNEPDPTAGVPAFSAVARIVENVLESKQIELGPAIKAAVFRKPDRSDAAIWAVNPKDRIKMTVLANPKTISISDIMGNPLEGVIIEDFRAKEKKVTFELGTFPIYLGKEGKRAFSQLSQILSKAKIEITPVKISFHTPEIRKAVVHMENQTAQDLDIEITAYIPDCKPLTKKATILKAERLSVEFTLPEELPYYADKEIKVEVSCKGFDEKGFASFSLPVEICKKLTFPVKIDGDLSEWSKHPYILMNQKNQVFPAEPWIHWTGTEDLSAKVYIGWNEDNFYFAAEVTDDEQVNLKKGSDIWNGDCIQLAFDTLCDACVGISMADARRGHDSNDYELGIALLKDGPSFYQWFGSGNVREAKELFIVRKGNKTLYELRIPFSALTPSHWKEGKVFGFNFVIPDDDEGGAANYWYQLAPGIFTGKDPRHFRKFVLVE